MKELPLIEVTELLKGVESSDTYQDDLSVADLSGERMNYEILPEHSTPMRLDAILMVLVEAGSAEISIDYMRHEIGANTLITLMPTHIIQVLSVSKELRGKLLIISRSFIESFGEAGKKKRSTLHYMQIRKNPCVRLDKEETRLLSGILVSIREKMGRKEHLLHKELLQHAVAGFLIEVANIFLGKKELTLTPTLSRKEELFEQFLELLSEHCREQHVVTFYAERLFITPQYLSLILKELTGKSANKWIDDALVVEAKILLKAPQVTVQQVADMLHFSDQSTFGKFFKKHMGVSPMEYRKS